MFGLCSNSHSIHNTLSNFCLSASSNFRLSQVFKAFTAYRVILWTLVAFGVAAATRAGLSFPLNDMNPTVIGILGALTVLSALLHIKIPQINLRMTFSDAVVMLAFLLYGIEAGIFVAILEAGLSSLSARLNGNKMPIENYFLNASIAAISAFLSATVAQLVFGSIPSFAANSNLRMFAALITALAVLQFMSASVLTAVMLSLQHHRNFVKIWYRDCLSSSAIYAASAAGAGLAYFAITQFDLGAVVFGALIVGLVFVSHRIFVANTAENETQLESTKREQEVVESKVRQLHDTLKNQENVAKSLRESNEKYRHAAFHDSLTNLPNRENFVETLRGHFEKTNRTEGDSFAVLYLDLNRFKTINDSLGHAIGDQLIMFVAERLTELIGENDLVARFAGDEFGIILSSIPDLQHSQGFADRVKQRLQEPFLIDGRQVFTSVSIGIAGNHERYTKAEEVLRDADIAMYHAKETGTPCVVFDQAMHSRAVNLLQLETDLRAAIKKNELVAHFQPIVGLQSLELVGFEALIRWNHPKRGLVPPGEFIPIAEETGLIIPITLWMLFHSCRQLAIWNRKFSNQRGLILSVNLSGKHFEDPNLVRHVSQVICETTVDPISLKLELTESAIMNNADSAIQMLRQLRNLGVQLSIDDFGTGYSSLSYLHKFPIDTLKVDRSFVGSMEEASENGEIVKTVVGLAKALRMNVVAEGIETIHQLHQLRILGCEYGQGFLFSKAVPIEEAELMIEDRFRWKNILPDPTAMKAIQNGDSGLLDLGDSI